MKYPDLEKILNLIGVTDIKKSASRENSILIPCPLAPLTHVKGTDSKPSCSMIYDQPDKPTLFHCFTCKEKGTLAYMVQTVGQLKNDISLIKLGVELADSDQPTLEALLDWAMTDSDTWVREIEVPDPISLDDSILDNFENAWEVDSARNFLISREVTEIQSKQWQLLYARRTRRVVFPVRNKDGILVGAVGRGINDSIQPKYWNFFGFLSGQCLGGIHRINNHPRTIVCEGWLDLVHSYEWADAKGLDVVCTFTSVTSPTQWRDLSRFESNLLYFYDQDDAGNRGWNGVVKQYGQSTYGLRRAIWNPNASEIDHEDTRIIDLGNIQKNEFDNIIDEMLIT